jgi:hypothetical protein
MLVAQNIFEGSSLSDGDTDRYVIVRKLPDFILKVQRNRKLKYYRFCSTNRTFIPQGCLLDVSCTLNDVLDYTV